MDRFRLLAYQILPVKIISRLVGKFARSSFSRPLIPIYARCFNIDCRQAEHEISAYNSLRDFFIRRLQPGLRIIDPDPQAIVSPVDGMISNLGLIEADRLIQAKGVYFTVADLLAGEPDEWVKYRGGQFITIYLSPRDYHRIHTPLTGTVKSFTYVPGSLFPVNPFGVKAVKGLFARNERLITYLETRAGWVAVVKVGATIVGSVRVVYDDSLNTNITGGRIRRGQVNPAVVLAKGEELGRFEFGSTVILLFEPGRIKFREDLEPGRPVQMGEKFGWII